MPTSAKEFAEYSDDSFASNISEDELKLQSPKASSKKKKKKVPKNVRVKKPPSPYGQPMKSTGPKKTSEEMWLDGIHKGKGLTASVKSSNYLGLTGKKTLTGGSCSDYLRETVLGMPAKKRSQSAMDDTFTRSTKGVPVYKPQEDMYDDILDLRKAVTALKQENEYIKARNRRLEDDNKMKEKYIDELMMASRTGDMRMTSSGKIVDPTAKIITLKQKNVKLEMSVREKENTLKKLNEDMKCTNIDEMKIAMETFYQEVQRLRIEQSENEKLSRSMKQSGNNNAKLKALNATVLRLTEANQRLQSENKLLKLDLERAMDKSSPRVGTKGSKGDYKDMDRQNLLSAISKLEKELEESKGREIKNKVSEANKRELQETIDKQEKEVKRLKEEKSKLKRTIDEQEQEIKDLNGKLKKITAQILKESEEAAAKSRTRHSSSESVQRTTPRSRSGSSASLRRKQKEEERRLEEQERKANELRKNNSAKSIQRNWRAHKKHKEEEEELNAATVTIQSAFRGHESRKKHLQQLNRYTPSPVNRHDKDDDSDEEDDSDMEDVATTIQSAARGHWGRQKQLSSYSARNSEISDAESVSSKRSSRSAKSNASKKQEKTKKQIAREYLEDSEDSSDVLVTSKTSRPTSRTSSRNTSPRLSDKSGKSTKKSVLDDSDDDSDEVVVSTPRRRSYQFGR